MIEANQKLILPLRQGPLPEPLDPAETQSTLEAGLATALDLRDPVTAKMFLQRLPSSPETASLLMAKGRLALLQNTVEEARADLQKAAQRTPQSPEINYWLATAEQRSGEEDAARARIEQLLQAHPQFLPALEEQMTEAVKQADWPTALEAQKNRMALLPDPQPTSMGDWEHFG